MNSIEQNKKYKLEKKIEKLKKDYEKKLKKTQLSLEQKRQEHLQKMSSAINTKYDKKLARIKKKQQERLEKKKREILGKKKLKKHTKTKTKSKLFQELYKLVQKYVRLKNSDVLWMCYCISCWKHDHYKNMQWWHLVGRANMVTAFDENNVQPQCPRCNMAMAGKFWLDEAKKIENQYIKNLSDKIWSDKVKKLLASKWKIKDWKIWEIQEMIEHYKKENKILESKKQQRLI